MKPYGLPALPHRHERGKTDLPQETQMDMSPMQKSEISG